MIASAEQVLDEACRILSDPTAWYKGDFNNANEITTGVPSAWCSLGVIGEAYRRLGRYDVRDFTVMMTPAGEALKTVVADLYPEYIAKNISEEMAGEAGPDAVIVPMWNDDRKRLYAEVVEVFEKARAWAAEKGGI